MAILPKSPQLSWLNSFCEPQVIEGKVYTLNHNIVRCKLDQNESTIDWPKEIKEKICNKLLDTDWNRYPTPYCSELYRLLAKANDVSQENIIAGPGSNYMLCVLLSLLSKQMKGKMIIARPSFPLFEQFCEFNGIKYENWLLNEDLQYDISKLPDMPDYSVLIFASPNNPVGNTLPYDELKIILEENPKTFVIADEAYFEFTSRSYTDLLASYSNLVIVRTLSKAMAGAGIRLGYIIGSKELITLANKVILPYMLNNFTITAVCEILSNEEYQDKILDAVEEVKSERKRLYNELTEIGKSCSFQVIQSDANFLLLRWKSQETCIDTYHKLIENSILVRNVSAGPMLSGCLRLTVGRKEENDYVLNVFNSFVV